MDINANAGSSAYDYETLNEQNTTPIPASQPHVVLKLRREDDDKVPWIVELVFLLFNAQGDILQVLRGAHTSDTAKDFTDRQRGTYFGKDNFQATHATLKDAAERACVRFSMAKFHPYVEVVGCLVTYTEDEIAHSPQLNAFSLTCDLYAIDSTQPKATPPLLPPPDVKQLAFHHAEEHTRLLELSHDPKAFRKRTGKQPNVRVVAKMFRRRGAHHDWIFHAATGDRSNVVVRSAVTASLVEAMHVFMLDIMPDLTIPYRNPLSSVAGICAALNCDSFQGIERHFPGKGLPKIDFARLVLWELLRTRPGLRQDHRRATALVGLLFEMFEQIDINGDAVVDWEELTSFCVALNLVKTPHGEATEDSGPGHGESHTIAPRNVLVYRQEPLSNATAIRTFPYQVNKLKTFWQLKRLAIIEYKSSRILMFDLDINFLHELNCSEKLAAEKKGGEKVQDGEPLEVLDVEHIPSRNALAVASSDLRISLWSIIDATVGSYVFNGKLVGRFPALFIKWCPPPLKRLFVAGGSTEQVQLWDLDIPMLAGTAPSSPSIVLPQSHTERIAACLDLPETPYIATASFDHTITIWETVESPKGAVGKPSTVLKVSFVLHGHQQAVLTLDSAHMLLLSSGFEYQAYCWGLSGRTLKTKLGGHHHCLIGAKFVSSTANEPCLVVTGDQSGHFKLWDITRCAKGFAGNHLSIMLQAFELHTPNLCRFRMFTTSSSGSRSLNSDNGSDTSVCDIITGNLRLYRFRAYVQFVGSDKDAITAGLAPTRFLVYNAVTNTFVGVVENRIIVWSANSGAKLEEPIAIQDAEVCALTFDSPRERKLFIATTDGAIGLYNPVTGALLQKRKVHEGPITSLVFCSQSNCLISTGNDRMVCVLDSPSGKAKLEVIHYVEKAHNSSITCCACSPPSPSSLTYTTRFVATADEMGEVHVYDLRRITLLFRCANQHAREIRALHFPRAIPGMLLSADVAGAIFVWSTTRGQTSPATPLMRLVMQDPMHSVKAGFTGITSICSTNTYQDSHLTTQPRNLYLGVENGHIFAWDLASLGDKFQSELCSPRRPAISYCLPSEGASIPVFENKLLKRKALAPQALSVMLSTKSWIAAHHASILSVQSVNWPGDLLSLDADGIVKIWDHHATCIGHIVTTGAQTSASASEWKFIRHDHLVEGDERKLFEQIAREVIAKHQRRLKKELNRLQTAKHEHDEVVPDTSSSLLDLDMTFRFGLNLSTKSLFPNAPRVLVNAATTLMTQPPFSVTSVASGIQHGLFGQEEAQHLWSIAKTCVSDQRKRVAALAPLFSTPKEMRQVRAKAKARAYASMKKTSRFDTRTLPNYSLELGRRTATTDASLHALRSIDVEPSSFLRDKLQHPTSPLVKYAKSTPKKHLYRSVGPDMKTNASMVILTRNVSLPKLSQSTFGQEADDLSRALSSSTSAPALPASAPLAESCQWPK